MTRICVIGNSHVGCLKLAWNQACEQHPSTKLTFFAAPGQSAKDLIVTPTKITPGTHSLRKHFAMTSKSSGEIELDEFEVFLIVGLLPTVPLAANLALSYAPDTLSDVRSDYRVSEGLFIETLVHSYRATVSFQIARLIRTPQHRRRVYICADPLPSEQIAKAFENWSTLGTSRNGAALKQLSDQAALLAAGDEFNLVRQPQSTSVNGLFTKDFYCTGSVRLDEKAHRENDYFHMNTEFGLEILNTVLGKLNA
jgi:hypothetical protein